MELGVILGVIFGYALIKGILDQRTKERMERLRILEQALRNPSIDRDSITALAQQITGRKAPQAPNGPGRLQAFVLAIGWLTLFSGLGILAIGELTGAGKAAASGVLVAVIGFGLVTYPFALRELEARRQA